MNSIEEPNRRVLVVDDNEAIHRDFRKILASGSATIDASLAALESVLFDLPESARSAEYEIETATQGEEALGLVRRANANGRSYSVVFLDVRMPPGIDGVETACRLLEMDPDVQIILCTAFSDHSWESMSYRFGPTDRVLILKKPFDRIEVLQLAQTLSEKWRLTREAKQRMLKLDDLVRVRTRELESSNRRLQAEIAEHARAEAELGSAKAELEQILLTVPSALVQVDAQGAVRHWNPWAERLFSAPAASVVGRPFRDSGIGWEWERIHEELASRQGDSWLLRLHDLPYLNREGRQGFLNLIACPLPHPGGGASGTLWFATDNTDRRGLEMQLLQAQKLESVGRLAAGIAHELNTPIQYVCHNIEFISSAMTDMRDLLHGYSSLAEAAGGRTLDRELLDQLRALGGREGLEDLERDLPQAIDETRAGLLKVAGIVQAMQVFSPSDAPSSAPTDLNRSVESTVLVSRHEWSAVADVVCDLDPELPEVVCLGGELNQALLALLVNSAHAIADQRREGKGLIQVRTRRCAAGVRVEIEDDGPGIPESIRDRVFDPFFTTKEPGRGTGQGLSIARGIVVDKHGGRLDFSASESGGCVFSVELPLEPGV